MASLNIIIYKCLYFLYKLGKNPETRTILLVKTNPEIFFGEPRLKSLFGSFISCHMSITLDVISICLTFKFIAFY